MGILVSKSNSYASEMLTVLRQYWCRQIHVHGQVEFEAGEVLPLGGQWMWILYRPGQGLCSTNTHASLLFITLLLHQLWWKWQESYHFISVTYPHSHVFGIYVDRFFSQDGVWPLCEYRFEWTRQHVSCPVNAFRSAVFFILPTIGIASWNLLQFLVWNKTDPLLFNREIPSGIKCFLYYSRWNLDLP